MLQCGQHPVFSTQAAIHRKVTPQLPERHHNYLISQLSSQDRPPITYFCNRRRKWCMKYMQCVYAQLKQAWKKPKQRGSSSLPVTPQSSKINLLASWLFTWPYKPSNSWLQWESATPHCHFKALWSPECNRPVFMFISREISCLRTAASKMSPHHKK